MAEVIGGDGPSHPGWEALCRSQAVAQYGPDGALHWANAAFLALLGLAPGAAARHHRDFCRSEDAAPAAHADFWDGLARGGTRSGVFRRRRGDGGDVWLRESYGPVLGGDGRVAGVLEIATDVSATRARNVEFESRLAALDRSEAVITFDTRGHVLDANRNYLDLFGYALRELVGRHHSTLCPPDYAASPQYREFWRKLARGEFDRGRYERRARDGRPVWIQASYNPVLDADGRPVRLVKFATDITREVRLEQELAARLAEAEQLQQALRQRGRALESTVEQLGQVVSLVESIADQTALLALNAAIEAARAGEAGRTFGVVAAEVKKLAGDTRLATERASGMMGAATGGRGVAA